MITAAASFTALLLAIGFYFLLNPRQLVGLPVLARVPAFCCYMVVAIGLFPLALIFRKK